MAETKKLTFEKALTRLEEIVSLLEEGEQPLEKALTYYEEGIKLARFCSGMLDAAEKKIEILSAREGGEPIAVPFEKITGSDTEAAPPDKETGPDSPGTEEQLLL